MRVDVTSALSMSVTTAFKAGDMRVRKENTVTIPFANCEKRNERRNRGTQQSDADSAQTKEEDVFKYALLLMINPWGTF